MSPRAASRLESLGFEQVYDFVAGKADWGSAGLPLEGANGSETRAGAHLRTDVPTCRQGDRLHDVCERLEESGWDTCFVVDERMQQKHLTSLPVTTPDGRLVGLLTLHDAEDALLQLAR